MWSRDDQPGTREPLDEMPRTVLVADENRTVRQPLAARLRAHGYRVIEAENGIEFLEYLSDILAGEAFEERPEIVVCDMRMPGVTSLASIASLRQSRRAPMVVLTTANGDVEASSRARRLGADGVFVQPLELEDIVRYCERIAPP